MRMGPSGDGSVTFKVSECNAVLTWVLEGTEIGPPCIPSGLSWRKFAIISHILDAFAKAAALKCDRTLGASTFYAFGERVRAASGAAKVGRLVASAL